MSDEEEQAEARVSLGKRKSRDHNDGEELEHGATLFVSNLPYAATSTDLQTVFSDLAPVRSAFVVLEGNVSKGVGYVAFALKEDATMAMDSIEKDGIEINGRKLRVQWADRKQIKDKSAPVAPKPKVERKQANFPKQQVSRAPKDPDAIRTIVVSGMPESVDQRALWKKMRKYEGAESAQFVEGSKGVANVLFTGPREAVRAVEKLHAHVFKGSLLSVTLKKRVEALVKTADSKSSAPSRASRLIIRNLPWNITEQDLRALFLPFGPIYSIHIPAPSQPAEVEEGKTPKKPKARGFAFIWFFSKKDAESAIDGVNGQAVTAGAISAPTMNKKERARMRRRLREEQQAAGQDDEDDGEGEEGEEDEEMDAETTAAAEAKTNERIVAVDWALSKERWEDAKAQGLEAEETEADGSVEAPEESEDEDEAGSDDVSDEDEDEDDAMDVDGERSGCEEEPTKPSLPAPEDGTTLFIRNLPFEATEDELRTLFRSFGPLRYARITIDHDSGRSRGTGFACFWKKEDADKAVHQSELLNRESGLDAPKKNPFALPSILTPDPSSSLAQSLVMHGRTLHVTRAVTRDQAQKLKDDGERSREKADKRNLYLLREGVIFPNSPAAANMPSAELEKRNISFTTRRNLIKSNPSLYVSKTRLSIRQLPHFATERLLKRLANHSIRTFDKEVKSKAREALTVDELREEESEETVPDGSNPEKKEKGKKAKFGERDTRVRQAKIVRQSDRVDLITGKGKSRGYGFLELNQHADALRVLRWANNNPEVGALLEEWWKDELADIAKGLEVALKAPKSSKDGEEPKEDIPTRLKRVKEELERMKSGEYKKNNKALVVEFSIENVQVVNRRKEQQKDRGQHKSSKAVPDSDEEVDDDKPAAKRRKLAPKKPTVASKSAKAAIESVSGEKSKGQMLGSLIGRKRKERKSSSKRA